MPKRTASAPNFSISISRSGEFPNCLLIFLPSLSRTIPVKYTSLNGLRDVRAKNEIKPKEPIKLHIQAENNELYKAIEAILKKQVNIEEISFVTQPVGQTITAVIDKDKFYIESERPVDTGAQKEQLLKDLDYYTKFLESVNKKLSNERFVQSARPDVVQLEQKKKLDAEEKIRAIEDSLKNL